MFFKIDVLKNFAKFHRKTPVLQSLFDKVVGLQTCNFIKKRLEYRCFFCEICEFFKNTFFYRTSPVAVSGVSSAK